MQTEARRLATEVREKRNTHNGPKSHLIGCYEFSIKVVINKWTKDK